MSIWTGFSSLPSPPIQKSGLPPLPKPAAGWPGLLAKRQGKRACLAEPDIESNLRHRQLALGQQDFGTVNAPAGQISVRRHAEGFLECSGKMERAELCQPSQGRQRDLIGKMLFD